MTKKRNPTEATDVPLAEAEEVSVSCVPVPEAEAVVEVPTETADANVAEVKVEKPVPKAGGSDLQVALEKIIKFDGVKGYILKDAKTATVNLDPPLLVEYALLASQTFDYYSELESLFSLGSFKSTTVEYKNLKVFCMLIGESTVNIFMAKNANPAKIQSALLKFR